MEGAFRAPPVNRPSSVKVVYIQIRVSHLGSGNLMLGFTVSYTYLRMGHKPIFSSQQETFLVCPFTESLEETYIKH